MSTEKGQVEGGTPKDEVAVAKIVAYWLRAREDEIRKGERLTGTPNGIAQEILKALGQHCDMCDLVKAGAVAVRTLDEDGAVLCTACQLILREEQIKQLEAQQQPSVSRGGELTVELCEAVADLLDVIDDDERPACQVAGEVLKKAGWDRG